MRNPDEYSDRILEDMETIWTPEEMAVAKFRMGYITRKEAIQVIMQESGKSENNAARKVGAIAKKAFYDAEAYYASRGKEGMYMWNLLATDLQPERMDRKYDYRYIDEIKKEMEASKRKEKIESNDEKDCFADIFEDDLRRRSATA